MDSIMPDSFIDSTDFLNAASTFEPLRANPNFFEASKVRLSSFSATCSISVSVMALIFSTSGISEISLPLSGR